MHHHNDQNTHFYLNIAYLLQPMKYSSKHSLGYKQPERHNFGDGMAHFAQEIGSAVVKQVDGRADEEHSSSLDYQQLLLRPQARGTHL